MVFFFIQVIIAVQCPYCLKPNKTFNISVKYNIFHSGNTFMSILSSVLQVVTKDLVCTEVSAVCYYRIENVSVCYSSLAGVPDVLQALVQVSVREVLAYHSFSSILQHRGEIAHQIQVHIISLLEG